MPWLRTGAGGPFRAVTVVPQLALLDVKLSEVGKGVEGTSNGKHKTSAK